ncbi:nuclease-related domain-containing protein [Arthrobacter sp. FW306-04-A]|uniref:nuclease-related domain-containing protein n=1 Tax=Arthrobacter sp. FW306-04-A TaxID=2879619 RepID=UPI0037C04BE5|nr:NERD domain-containing protein [Arthrobacter sp. FW306-04-A]
MEQGQTSHEIPSGQSSHARVDLRDRTAGHAVIERLLQEQAGVRARSFLARVFGANPLGPASLSWYQGALGEISVGQVLERLGPEWTVLHAVPVGTGVSDIDHVLIGPTGVFTLNTKNHTGQAVWVAGRTLMVAGKKQRHLYNAAHEASRAAALLSRRMGGPVPVTAVVVILAPKSLTVRASPEGAVVLTATRLLGWLAARPRILGPRQVGMLSAVACQPGTWHRDPPSMMDPARIRQEFAALRAAVNRARACRIGWLLALLISAPLILSSLSRHF